MATKVASFFEKTALARCVEIMESTPFDSERLLAEYKAGQADAADEIFERYVRRLVPLAAERLAPALRRRIDPEDVVQSAMRSFFVHARDGDYVLARSGDLWRLLATITLHKLRDQVDRHRARRRDYRREYEATAREQPAAHAIEPESLSPTPDEEVAAAENVQKLLNDLPDAVRDALALRLAGNRVEDIAAAMQRSERTVRRLLEMARRVLSGSIAFRGAKE